MLVLLSTLLAYALGQCTTTSVAQDFYLMIDYSGSICSEIQCCGIPSWQCPVSSWQACCVNEWELTLDFSAQVVNGSLPPDTRFGVMGFGQEQASIGWYFGGSVDGWITDGPTAADLILNPDVTIKWEGPTYLGAGIDFLLSDPSDGGKIDFSQDTDRQRLLMVVTDGDATDGDTLCQRAPQLKAYNIDVVIVGITENFYSSTVSCLVDSDADIILVDDFEDLDSQLDEIVKVTCVANQVWEVSEIKTSGSDGTRFVEYVNRAAEFDGSDSNIVVTSNLFDSPFTLGTSNIPQASHVVIGSMDEGSMTSCTSSATCFYFQHTFSSAYTSVDNKNDGWSLEVSQDFTQGTAETLQTVYWDSSWPQPSDDESFELINLGYDGTQGGNWRASCSNGGSPGESNPEVCGNCQTQADCNYDDLTDNDCVSLNCDCSDGYYAGTDSCLRIPTPNNCLFWVNEANNEDQYVSWEAAKGSQIYGYEVVGDLKSATNYGSVLRQQFVPGLSTSENVRVRAIGAVSDSGNIERRSVDEPCTLKYFTTAPTVTPTHVPTKSPTEYQPLVFVSGFALDDQGDPEAYRFQLSQTKEVSVRIYLAPPTHETTANWEVEDSTGNIVESGSVTFPADALAMLEDTQKVQLTNFYGIGPYTFRLLETTDLMPDNSGRALYKTYNPSELGMDVVADPQDQPSAAPTNYQPLALLGGITMNEETGEFNDILFHSNQLHEIEVRITPSPPFEVFVNWACHDAVTDALVENGIVDFPADALFNSADIQIVTLNNLRLEEADDRKFTFRLLPANLTIPNDPRDMYDLYTPYFINITLELYEQDTVVVDGGTEEVVDWWLILIIVLIAVAAMAVCAYFAYQRHKSYLVEKEAREDAERELEYEEDGIDGFYKRAGINQDHVADNPLHNEQVTTADYQDQGMDRQAEMVLVDDDQPFTMAQNQSHYGQKLINIDNKGNRLSEGAADDTQATNRSSVYSVSACEIEPGTLPDAFGEKRDPRGSMKFQ